jgi:hypothetical protein
MKEKKKFFREALERYYKTSFIKRKDRVEPDFGDKVNNCIIPFLKNKDAEVSDLNNFEPIKPKTPTKSVIVLPSGCYTRMLESDDLELYKKCLSQFSELTEQQIIEINRCIRGGKIRSCYLNPIIEFETTGGFRYVDCCGQTITAVTDKSGSVEINTCVTNGTIESYSDGMTDGAKIKGVDYGNKSCLCDKEVKE